MLLEYAKQGKTMSVDVIWADDARTIVRYTFAGMWSWDEFYLALDHALEMENSVPHRVDVIVDLRRSERIPSNALSHMQIIANKQPANLQLSVFITDSLFACALLRVLRPISKTVNHHYRIVPDLERAYTKIQEDRRDRKQN